MTTLERERVEMPLAVSHELVTRHRRDKNA
jgi:hypothetical protein